jgi:hypothetical protein
MPRKSASKPAGQPKAAAALPVWPANDPPADAAEATNAAGLLQTPERRRRVDRAETPARSALQLPAAPASPTPVVAPPSPPAVALGTSAEVLLASPPRAFTPVKVRATNQAFVMRFRLLTLPQRL